MSILKDRNSTERCAHRSPFPPPWPARYELTSREYFASFFRRQVSLPGWFHRPVDPRIPAGGGTRGSTGPHLPRALGTSIFSHWREVPREWAVLATVVVPACRTFALPSKFGRMDYSPSESKSCCREICYRPAVLTQQRSASATLQACARQLRAICWMFMHDDRTDSPTRLSNGTHPKPLYA